MDSIINLITGFAQEHATLVIILFFVSEALASIGSIKGNSIFQVVKNILNGLRDAVIQKPPAPPK